MFKINLVVVGTLKESYWTAAIAEYAKRLTRYAEVALIEVAEDNGERGVESEGEAVLKRCKGKLFVMDSKGDDVTSESFAELIKDCADKGETISFAIGGSRGLSDGVKAKANKLISFGKVTYPHQLMRVILYEQIYRAMNIINHGSYHK